MRAKLYSAEVAALQFNVLVTTYEYIMRDRARLSKVLAVSRLVVPNDAVPLLWSHNIFRAGVSLSNLYHPPSVLLMALFCAQAQLRYVTIGEAPLTIFRLRMD